jgi:hypothetical protein
MPATVSNPRGGKAALLETSLSTCLKLQKVSGVRGLTRRIFIADIPWDHPMVIPWQGAA